MSDVNIADVAAAGSSNRSGLTGSVDRLLSAFVFGPVHVSHHWIVMKKKKKKNLTQTGRHYSEQPQRFSADFQSM